ncbi:MAG: ECF transporter S component [Ruminococcus sp.]|nr:ECF transporter S component [Ruminococcus sp.]
MKNNEHIKLRKLTLAALLAAFTCVATFLIQIPTPTKGYVNLGDSLVNISAWLLGPVYGTASAGIGSALADFVTGYVVYAPATLVIKSLLAVASFFTFKALSRKLSGAHARIIAAAAAELIMAAGYFAYEAVLYGSVTTALLGISANLVQGGMSIAVSSAVYELILKRIPKLI